MSNFQIQTWFCDHHDADLDDVFHFAEKAAEHGNIRRLNFDKAPYNVISVVWSGDKDVTNEDLLAEIEKEWANPLR